VSGSRLIYVVKDASVELDSPPDLPGITRFAVDRPAPEVDTTNYPGPGDVVAVAGVWTAEDVGERAANAYPAGSVDGYQVEERLQWNYQRDWPLGSPSPGIKQMSFLRRLPSIDREEFASHWSDIHTGLARVHHPTIWRYAQNVVLRVVTPDSPYLDGVAELSFRTVEDWSQRKYDSDEGKRIITEDIAKFLDAPHLWHVITHEYVLAEKNA
jgi:uncharacterized protein (TIGR02118 family)